ncbi:hypothetical protein WMY93_008898 [Mugilogobius chulae]|uniref:Uncharacterized protein n=1 Tax=Mugilogobius chulae TaxID=88201 RepID=A0AAW0PB79_9GOBI
MRRHEAQSFSSGHVRGKRGPNGRGRDVSGPGQAPEEGEVPVASGSSGRVLKEMFKDEGPSDSLDSDCTSNSDADRASTPSTSGDSHGHLYGFMGSELDDSESEPDELLMYAGAPRTSFTAKRVNILSQNGTVRGSSTK